MTKKLDETQSSMIRACTSAWKGGGSVEDVALLPRHGDLLWCFHVIRPVVIPRALWLKILLAQMSHKIISKSGGNSVFTVLILF